MCPSYDGPQAAHLWSVHLTRLTLQLRRNAIEYGKPSIYKLHHFPVKKKFYHMVHQIRVPGSAEDKMYSKAIVPRRELNEYLLTKYILESAQTLKKNMTLTHRGLMIYNVYKMKSLYMELWK